MDGGTYYCAHAEHSTRDLQNALAVRDTDPLVGEPHPGSTKLTVPGTPPYFVTARPRPVTMRGGAYLFQPSMTALRHLAGLDA